MNAFLRDWRNLMPIAGLAAVAAAGVVFAFRRGPEDVEALERRRRAYLNRVGRIVEGHVLEIVEHDSTDFETAGSKFLRMRKHRPSAAREPLAKLRPLDSRRSTVPGSARKLLHYSYAISGVSYETAQDITGLEERLHLARVAVGQVASVKYDPSNPSNSILLADDWSGLH